MHEIMSLHASTTCTVCDSYVVYIIGEVVFHISSFIIHVLTALNSSQLLAVHVLTGGSDQSDSRL